MEQLPDHAQLRDPADQRRLRPSDPLRFAATAQYPGRPPQTLRLGSIRWIGSAELSDASVPFHFDVHLMVYSDDAVGLETTCTIKSPTDASTWSLCTANSSARPPQPKSARSNPPGRLRRRMGRRPKPTNGGKASEHVGSAALLAPSRTPTPQGAMNRVPDPSGT